jgi:1,4-alpha-glucan branching enzyme
MTTAKAPLDDIKSELSRIAGAAHHQPHAVLGRHVRDGRPTVLAYIPSASQVRLERSHEMQRLPGTDFFYWQGESELPGHYRLSWLDNHGTAHERVDPYSFAPTIGAETFGAYSGGWESQAWHFLGSHVARIDGVDGVRFTVWAPNAERVSIVGPFCNWDGRRYPMRVLGSSGVWELFIPGLEAGTLYKFEVRNRTSGTVLLKCDPYARAAELRPATASIVTRSGYRWGDEDWMRHRHERDWLRAPMSVYEVHAGSWRRHADGRFLNYRELAHELVPYVQRLGFTHVELMPLAEYPLDDSWGYQITGYFAPTSRYGTPDDLRYLIDYCHRHGIGVLHDWVPGHFPRDAHGLANFDGTALYEYHDPRKAEHRDWGTLIFNYERHEIRSFLLSSACYWLEEFHFDGLRVDAVASMLYLDFGRRGDFVPNRYGGTHNLEAIDFLRQLNATTHARTPGTVVVAEESTDWAMVSRPTDVGGLGFSMKWNMGWMHDTLDYFKEDPIYRLHHHDKLTFGMMYAYSENFVLPLSHDEVVHLKRSLIGRMPGDRWQQFANLRLLFAYMWTFPGKKLLFMGGEFGQWGEWDFRSALPWYLADDPAHSGVQRAVADLNRLYVGEAALHRHDFESQGFGWLDCNDQRNSVLSYARFDGERCLVVVLNFTPVPQPRYRVGVPRAGGYREVFNSDSTYYSGSNYGTRQHVNTEPQPWGAHAHSLELTLPPLGALVLAPEGA